MCTHTNLLQNDSLLGLLPTVNLPYRKTLRLAPRFCAIGKITQTETLLSVKNLSQSHDIKLYIGPDNQANAKGRFFILRPQFQMSLPFACNWKNKELQVVNISEQVANLEVTLN